MTFGLLYLVHEFTMALRTVVFSFVAGLHGVGSFE